MKIIFELNHPAHLHLFKNTANALVENGHPVLFVVRAKDVLLNLASQLNKKISLYCRSTHEKSAGTLANIKWLFESDYKMLNISRKFKPDMLIGSNFSFAHVSRVFGLPSLLWAEDDVHIVKNGARISYPFATHLFSPVSCNNGRWEYKSIHYNGFQKLAYLHPNYFTPDKQILKKYKIKQPYFLLRFSSLAAHHDNGKTGISDTLANVLLKKLIPFGDIFISSERTLPKKFEKFALKINPIDIHHLLYFANIYIGDSQSMSVESALLGTPGLRFNDFAGEIGVLEELEQKYGLACGVKTSQPEKLIKKVDELLNTPNLKQEFQRLRQKMLADKIDVTAFMVWFVENYPESFHIMKQNPDYQYRFK